MTRLTSHDSLYEETKWEKLKDRRNNHKLVLFHKMNYNKTPQYLVELIPKLYVPDIPIILNK